VREIVIGVDLGGTLVRAGAFDLQGKLLAQREAPIEAARGPEAGLERIEALIVGLLHFVSSTKTFRLSLLRGIGIGCSGPVDPDKGLINNPHTLPTWENVPVVAWMQDRFTVPVRLENDADVAALGEYWLGAGKNVRRLYAITVGTGIGAALVIDGQIYRGLGGSHPDGGHQVIDPSGPPCYCGAHGCWESLASGSAIARMAREAVNAWKNETMSVMKNVGATRESPLPDTPLLDSPLSDSILRNIDPSQIDARMVAEAALAGDPLAMQVMKKAAHYFSLGVVNVVTLFVPEVIVLSGGVMKSAALFIPAIEAAMLRHNVMVPAAKVRILPAQLGHLAGLYGAAYTVVQS
jgi:glucokinase